MSGNCLEKDAKVEYEEVFDDRRTIQRGNHVSTRITPRWFDENPATSFRNVSIY